MKSYNLRSVAFSCLFMGMALFATPEAYAQKKKEPKKKETKKKEPAPKLSKDEKKAKAQEEKALKAEISAYSKNLDSYRAFKNAKATAEAEAGKLKSEVVRLKENEANCQKEVDGLRAEIEDLIAKLKAAEGKSTPTPAKAGFAIPTTGMYYVVQIGAFQQANVETNPDNPDLRKESADGFNKYIMGVFSTIDQADALRSFLTKIDFRRPQYRPFVVPYKDGARITLEDAIGPEEAAKRKKMMGQ